MNYTELVIPVSIVAGFLLAGILIRRLLIEKLQRYASTTKWKVDDIIVSALKGSIIYLFLVIGLYISVYILPLPPNIHDLLKKALLCGIVLLVTIISLKLVTGIIKYYGETAKLLNLSTATVFTNFTKILFLTLGGLIILQILGISITPMLTALGIGGLAVALALQDTLSNFFAGIHILLAGQIKVGDFVRMDTGEEGYIKDIGWRNTTILMLPNNMVVVPNSKLSGSILTNYSSPQKELNIYIPVGVSYSEDLERVEKVTVEVAEEVLNEVEGGMKGFKPLVRYKEFGDSSINFIVILRVRDYESQFLVRHEFIKRLHKRYGEEGIEIPFPIRTVYLKGEGVISTQEKNLQGTPDEGKRHRS